jgi:hypothetical protein
MENLKDKIIPVTRINKEKAPQHSWKAWPCCWKWSNIIQKPQPHIHMPTHTASSMIITWWSRQRSQYCDFLWAGQSGIWNPAGAGFSRPVQTSPKAHPVSCTMCTVSLLRVQSGWDVALTTHPFCHWGCVWVKLYLYLPLCLHAMSQGDLYLYLKAITYLIK